MLNSLSAFFQNLSLKMQQLAQKEQNENIIKTLLLTKNSVYAEVQQDDFYQVYIIKANDKISTECGCQKPTCQHIATATLAAMHKIQMQATAPDDSSSSVYVAKPQLLNSQNITPQPNSTSQIALSDTTLKNVQIDPKISDWIQSLTEQPITETRLDFSRYLLFSLRVTENELYVEMISSKLKQTGGYAKTGQYILSLKNLWEHASEEARSDLSENEWDIINYLGKNVISHQRNGFLLNFKGSGEFLKRLITTERCFIGNQYSTPLRWDNPKSGKFQWTLIIAKDSQKLDFILDNRALVMIKSLDPFCYYDEKNKVFGLIDFKGENVSKQFLNAPLIPNSQVKKVHQLLCQNHPKLVQEFPKEITLETIRCQPTPHLDIFCDDFIEDDDDEWNWNWKWKNNCRYEHDDEQYQAIVANLFFQYNDHFLECILDEDVEEKIEMIKKADGELIKIVRDLQFEKATIKAFLKLDWDFCNDESIDDNVYDFIYEASVPPTEIDLTTAAIQVIKEGLPMLKKMGFQVTLANSFPLKSVHESDEWYLDSGEEPLNMANDWFDVKFGVMIDGERVNLLPTLSKLIKQDHNQKGLFTDIADDKLYNLPTEDGRLIQVSAARLRKFTEHLMVDFANSNSDDKSLRVSKWNTGFLTEFSQGENAAKSRWIGSDTLQNFAAAIKENSISQEILPPQGLKCELRPYQKQGLNWMQFLSRCKLNGILADDMGLGKTVQTLAHILVEKEQGRATLPILVISPTSVVPNWFNEAARLAPSLKVLVLQGNERKQFFSKVSEYDLILTTYPLLMRDKEFLLAHQFHMIILDEAQTVKNFKTQAYQVIQQIKANQRLCLSGTPMENHLGELWSLFHLLLPGFLGDQKTFQALYRKPIEKNRNEARRDSLIKRIKPFILRRTKQQVALDLPDKTEIIQKIELKAPQRDLYEAIRMRAQNKVMAEIQKKGLHGSQIIVLDALLKLRQVCCDPRLVKMETSEKVEESAKLEFLMEMLTQMMEEKRKVLIFSQFTSMLTLIAQALDESKFAYTSITGKSIDRNSPVQEFQNGSTPIMLISLKAGGVGLNLTAADTVIHYDPWWNPAVENQATDRAHRIGQKKPVFVYKLVVSGSLEEKIIEMQERKKGLISALLDSNANIGSNLSMEDLEDIFKPLPPPI